MKARDRLVLMVIGALAILAAGWMLVVSPERKQAASLGGQVSQARSALSSAESQVAAARAAQAEYPAAYANVVRLGKAVPPGNDVASLVYQVAQASHAKSVDFGAITAGGGTSTPGATPPASGPGAAVSPAGFQVMPFTFKFTGSFFALYHLLNRLNGFTLQTNNGNVQVSGRLLTIDGANLAVGNGGAGGSPGQLSGSITATAYVLPAQQGLTGGATPNAPAGAPATSATPAPGGSGAPAPAAALARVTP